MNSFGGDPAAVEAADLEQGGRLVRWAAIEATTNQRGDAKLRVGFHRIAQRRGTAKARFAIARKLLTLVYYGLRDGEIRCRAEGS